VRRALEVIENDRKSLIFSLYANGNIGGNDLAQEIESINETSKRQRMMMLGNEDQILAVEAEFSGEDAPFLAPLKKKSGSSSDDE
jgi:hypothetical protein